MKVLVEKEWKEISLANDSRNKVTIPSVFFLTSGKEYFVFGISFGGNDSAFPGSVAFEILDDDENLVSVSCNLFSITDGSVPQEWVAKIEGEGLRLWPELFFSPYFFDDLSEGDEETVSAFNRIKAAMLKELSLPKG